MDDKLFRTEEFYSQCIEMVKDSIAGIQREIHPLKKFIGDRKKEVVRHTRINTNKDVSNILDFTREFYESTLNELLQMEEACEEHLLQLKLELSTSIKSRLQPLSYLSLEDVKRAYNVFMCCNGFDEIFETCRCTWKNVPPWNLKDTRNILLEPKEFMRVEFDEFDIKFKEEMVYLRMKMFSLPRFSETYNNNRQPSIKLSTKSGGFTKTLEEDSSEFVSIESKLYEINNVKFVDGKFTICNNWVRLLDAHGDQYTSKWHLTLCPQIENILKKRHIPVIHLDPRAIFNFMSRIEENGVNFILTKEDVISLLKSKVEAPWLRSWTLQFQTIDGKHIAATIIQAFWRGYLLRRRKWDSDCLYIAASFLWYLWLTLKKKRDIHERYLRKMLTSLQDTCQVSLKLSKEFNSIIRKPHVILHLPSIGYPFDLRQSFVSKMLNLLENTTSLRICFVRNPLSDVIYILPVKPTQDLLMMYSDFIESISPEENIAKRITFVTLSQAQIFQNRPMNLSRILHCSEESLNEIRRRIAGKPSYFLPWVIDECDMKVAGNLDIPLLSCDMELQQRFLNASKMAKLIDSFGLLQPPYAKDIKDYETLCLNLSNLIILHTEIGMWLIRLNVGLKERHYGIFLINHMSIPFMPMLRKEKEKYSAMWDAQPNIKTEYYKRLREHLPKVVSSVIRLPKIYNSWKEFYIHIQRFGCLLQAIPAEKHSRTIAVSLFIPGKMSGKKPRWMGTADKFRLESKFPTSIYMMPQSSLDTAKLKPVVNKFAMGMENEGYFGYLTVICYCYMHKQKQKLIVMLLNVHPFYSHVQSYIDWMKFATGGHYNTEKNCFVADVELLPEALRKKSYLIPQGRPSWNETTDRFAVAVSTLYHTRFSAYRWSQLKDLFARCDIKHDSQKKQGASILLHDSEIRTSGVMVSLSPCMMTTLSMVHNSLKKLNEILTMKSKTSSETNLPILVDRFSQLSLDYENLATDECI
ncbi:IQ motif-containing protein H [Calliopsis andreniformis]|uniref:IQ motif-containing protein H n=1 Tax=Calliopsis andreniformis TaxID=337506 RepID=UPI003FCDB341